MNTLEFGIIVGMLSIIIGNQLNSNLLRILGAIIIWAGTALHLIMRYIELKRDERK